MSGFPALCGRWLPVIPVHEPLSPDQQVRVNLRAQRIYQRTAQILPWGNVAEKTRAEFRRRATADMKQDGSLLNGRPVDGDDDGYAELLELDREADEVIRGGN